MDPAFDDASAVPPLKSAYLCTLEVDVGDLVSLGAGPYGERRFVPITGGRVRGPEMNGIIVPGGADWQVARFDGVLDIDAHYSLLLDDDARIEISSVGMRHGTGDVLARLGKGEDVDPSLYFFRTVVRFQTGAARWLDLNRTIAIGIAARRPAMVELTLHRVL